MLVTPTRLLAPAVGYRPSLDLATARNLDTRLTFTRASSGQYYSAAGVQATASTDAARFDCNPATLAQKGLLVEGARTNLALRSGDLTVSPWSRTNSTVAAVSATTPDGASTTNELIDDATNGSHNTMQTVTVVAGSVYTVSCIVKAGTASGCYIALEDSGATNGVRQAYDLATGAVSGALVTSGTGGSGSSGVIDLGGGWYRCWIAGTPGGAITSSRLRFYMSETGGSSRTYAGTGKKVRFHHAQFELGSFPSSPIATAGSSVARAADLAAVTTLTPWFSATAGTVYVEFMAMGSSGTQTVVSLDDGTANERITLRASAGTLGLFVGDGGVQQALLSLGSVVADTPYRVAFRYGVNDFAASANGGAVATDTSGTLPTVTQMVVGGRGAGSDPLFGWVPVIRYWPYGLSNNHLVELTS
jgi:hypothetical protein